MEKSAFKIRKSLKRRLLFDKDSSLPCKSDGNRLLEGTLDCNIEPGLVEDDLGVNEIISDDDQIRLINYKLLYRSLMSQTNAELPKNWSIMAFKERNTIFFNKWVALSNPVGQAKNKLVWEKQVSFTLKFLKNCLF